MMEDNRSEMSSKDEYCCKTGYEGVLMGERPLCMREISGSIPGFSTFFSHICH